MQQQMGDLSQEKFDIPFHQLMCGPGHPCQVKATNNARSKLKVWHVLFNCLNTWAVDIRLAFKQGTEAFLTAWNTFFAVRGDPVTVYSDRGTNLTKAVSYVEEEDLTTGVGIRFPCHLPRKGQYGDSLLLVSGCHLRDGISESRVKMSAWWDIWYSQVFSSLFPMNGRKSIPTSMMEIFALPSANTRWAKWLR
jgi:hypothetical protein